MTISFFGNPDKAGIREYLSGWVRHLLALNIDIAVFEALQSMVQAPLRKQIRIASSDKDLISGCDLLVSLGGDGTILMAAGMVGDRNIPILGVKFGGLGFLADVAPAEFEAAIEEVRAGTCNQQQRMLLMGEITGRTRDTQEGFTTLNDFVVHGADRSHVSRINCWLDDDFVGTYIADGLIIATPTGSTAYSMAAGGPMLLPMTASIVITPICSHTLNLRPLVIGSDQCIRLSAAENERQELVVSADGLETAVLRRGDELSIRQADYKINLLQRAGNTFFNVLRAKLHWGEDIRQKSNG